MAASEAATTLIRPKEEVLMGLFCYPFLELLFRRSIYGHLLDV